MNTVSIVERYKNRTVPFRYDGSELKFSLSLALFSSYDIDAGTKLLLKTLAQRVPLEKMHNFLDVGCGAGIIGISVATRHPHLKVTLQDRDALAAEFTAHNAELNGVRDYRVSADLAFLRLPEQRYNAVVSNIPAKAGEPVLAHMAALMIAHLGHSDESTAAVVVVEPLKKKFGKMIRESGGKIVYRESTKSHTVYHFVRADEEGGERMRHAGSSLGSHPRPRGSTITEPPTASRESTSARESRRSSTESDTHSTPSGDCPTSTRRATKPSSSVNGR